MKKEQLEQAIVLTEKMNVLHKLSQSNFWGAAETADYICVSFLARKYNDLLQISVAADGTLVVDNRRTLESQEIFKVLKSVEVREALKNFIELLKASIDVELVNVNKEFSSL